MPRRKTLTAMKNMTPLKNIIFAIPLFIQYSCTLIPCESYTDLDTVDYKPNDSDLVGEYKPDQQTIDNINGFSNSSIMTLTSDKKFSIKNFPESTFEFDAYYAGVNANINAIGKWGAYYSDYTADLSVSVDYGEKNEDGKFDFGTSWKIFKKGNKYTICIMVGDPDECAVIRLIKK